jgi:hypothetical protein
MQSTAYPPKIIKKKSIAKRIFKGIGITAATVIGLFIVLVVIATVTKPGNSDKPLSVTGSTNEPSKPEFKLGDRKNPVPVGSKLTYKIEQFTALTGANRHPFGIALQVNETIRGKDANDRVKSWNKLNADPKDGHEYLISNITIEVTDSDDSVPLDVNQNIVSLVSGEGIKYEPVILSISEPLNAKMYKGAKHAGWTAFLVKKDDGSPLIETAGVWFRAN